MKSIYDRYQPDSPEEAHLSFKSDVRAKMPGHYGALEVSYELDTLNLISVSGSLNANRNIVNYFENYSMSDA